MLSVIIPSRNTPEWPFLQKTIDDLFNKATGEIEIIVVLDGFIPDPPIKERDNLTILFNILPLGMRQGINAAAKIAKGKYIMKTDDHCMFAPGFDTALAEDCKDNWLAVPSRYSLDGENWTRRYGPIDHQYLTFPFLKDNQFGYGLHGKKWHGEFGFTGKYFWREKIREHILIDDIISFQGSCWFMPLELFIKIGGMQEIGYYQHQEAQELCFKVWLSGGRVVRNKKTWYAHLHKGKSYGRGYRMLKHQKIRSEVYSCDLWLNDKWPQATRKFNWLIEKFKPVPTWN